jgi:hypothetical protein
MYLQLSAQAFWGDNEAVGWLALDCATATASRPKKVMIPLDFILIATNL